MPTRLAVLLALVILAASPASAAPPDPAGPGGCTASLSGAVTARFPCTVEAHVEGKVVTVTVAADGPVAGLRAVQPATLKLPMPLATGTYAGTSFTSAASSLETTAGAAFAAGGGKGEVTLVVDQAERYRQLPDNLVVSGSIKARLVPAKKGAGGDAILEIKF